MAKSNLERQPVMTNSVSVFQILRRIPNIGEEEARVLANEITRNKDVATKTDLLELRLDLETKIAETKADLEAKMAEFQKELRHTMWTVAALLLTAQGIMLTAARFLS